MNAPVYVMPPVFATVEQPSPPPGEVADLLRQLLAVQQEQVGLLKAQLAHHDSTPRWRAFLARWEAEFPGLGSACRQALPAVERAYLALLRELTERLTADPEHLTDEFVLSEFLDRYGLRLGQLGNIMGQLVPLAEASAAPEKG